MKKNLHIVVIMMLAIIMLSVTSCIWKKTEAHLSIPNQYTVPEVDLLSPIEGTELATTTVTFTWEATPGTQTNAEEAAILGREVYGIKSYIVSFAGSDDVWASATINDADTKEYATDVLSYGEDYKWHVKAIGNNDKTAMTENATFQTLSRLRDLGTENEAYWITDKSLSSEYVVSVDAAYLPARFTGQTRFKITMNGLVYYFEAVGYDSSVYSTTIPYVVDRDPINNNIEDIKGGIFDDYFPVYVQAADQVFESVSIKEAVEALPSTAPATITLYGNEFKEGQEINIHHHYPLTFQVAEGFLPVLDGESTRTGFFINDSATITFKNLIFTNFYTETDPGAALEVYETNLIILNCEFTNNLSVNGGAVFLDDESPTNGHQLVISESTLTHNSAIRIIGTGYGGAVYTYQCPVVILKDSYFATNTAMGCGGAMRLEEPNTGVIENCRIEGNKAAINGGGIAVSVSSDYEIKHSMISENIANESAGGIEKTGAGNLTTNGNAWHIGSNPPGNMQENFSVDDTGALNTGGAILENDSVHVQDNEAYGYPERSQMEYTM